MLAMFDKFPSQDTGRKQGLNGLPQHWLQPSSTKEKWRWTWCEDGLWAMFTEILRRLGKHNAPSPSLIFFAGRRYVVCFRKVQIFRTSSSHLDFWSIFNNCVGTYPTVLTWSYFIWDMFHFTFHRETAHLQKRGSINLLMSPIKPCWRPGDLGSTGWFQPALCHWTVPGS